MQRTQLLVRMWAIAALWYTPDMVFILQHSFIIIGALLALLLGSLAAEADIA